MGGAVVTWAPTRCRSASSPRGSTRPSRWRRAVGPAFGACPVARSLPPGDGLRRPVEAASPTGPTRLRRGGRGCRASVVVVDDVAATGATLGRRRQRAAGATAVRASWSPGPRPRARLAGGAGAGVGFGHRQPGRSATAWRSPSAPGIVRHLTCSAKRRPKEVRPPQSFSGTGWARTGGGALRRGAEPPHRRHARCARSRWRGGARRASRPAAAADAFAADRPGRSRSRPTSSVGAEDARSCPPRRARPRGPRPRRRRHRAQPGGRRHGSVLRPIAGDPPHAVDAIRVVICDDHALFRRGLAMVPRVDEDGIEVVGEARTATDAVAGGRGRRPTSSCMDVRMPKRAGIEAARAIAESSRRRGS